MSPRAEQRIDWYDTPRWYDIVFDAGTQVEADFLEAVQQEHGVPGARVLEPACGSGRLVLELARRGHAVTGFDRSVPMLDFARARLARARRKATLLEADMSSFRLPRRFELAHCLVSTFKYLLDEESAVAHLACVARALVPGGIYVLGFHLSDYPARAFSRERWVERRGRTTVVCNTQVWPADRRARLERVRTRLVVRQGARERRTQTEWLFRTYDAREVRALLRRVPRLEHVATYDFGHDIRRPIPFDGERLDVVLVLRRA